MVQELVNLRSAIVEGHYEVALALVDELEGMSKQVTIRNIESYLLRLLIHLIKNQVERRLTPSWAVSISDSIRQIKKLNLKDNRTSYYISQEDWQSFLEENLEAAIRPASLEVLSGTLKPKQLAERLDKPQLMQLAQKLLNLTYEYSAKDLPNIIDTVLVEFPGGEEWES
ncbi:MAG: DUF29 domain-containing protein [Desertifilum sp.]|nr:DUF29 domain-containing protein [Desertifilum sp.]